MSNMLPQNIYCAVYKIVNIINQKIYIGQTWTSLSHRLGQHFSDLKCIKLANAVKKHGRANFKIELIIIANTQEISDYWEKYFITKFDAVKNGYNVKEGGSRGRISQEARQRISVANTGKKRTKEVREKLSLIHKGKLGPNKGISVPLNIGAGTPKGTKPWNTGTKGLVVPWNKGKKQLPLLTKEQELEITKDVRSARTLAKEYGVSKSHILNIRKRHKE